MTPAPHTEFRAAAILSVPLCIFLLTFFALLAKHGGHHHAHLSTNPFCKLPPTPPSLPPHPSPPVTLLLHISDLHVNDIDNGRAKRTLQAFRAHVLPRWAPLASAILVSGDLVNAVAARRYPFGGRSAQLAAEWRWMHDYAAAVNASVRWLVTHGNHDTFGVPLSRNPHVTACAPDGDPVQRTRVGAAGVQVFALDGTLQTPLHRPLNFFGDGRRAAAALADQLLHRAPGVALGFAHFPTALMAGGRRVHRAAGRRGVGGTVAHPALAAFLSGHLHTLKGAMPRGMQAVGGEGVLELELPDLAWTGAYRVLAVHGAVVSFRDFRVGEEVGGLNEVIVTNLPRAGLCSAGAGWEALRSSHVQLVGPESVMEGEELEVRIDGVSLGRVNRLPSSCETGAEGRTRDDGLERCVRLYGVPWNASLFDDGKPHELTIHSGTEQHAYQFSLNGVPEPGMRARVRRFVSAVFLLSDFEQMASRLCSLGFFFVFAFCSPGLLRGRGITFALFIMAALLRFGPAFIITYQLTDAHTGIGMAGLGSVRLPNSSHSPGIDLPYMLSVTVLFGSLVPVSFLDAVMSSRQAPVLRHSSIARFVVPLYLLKSFSWCLEVFGAHGVFAGLVSPSCTPLFIVCFLSVVMSFKAPSEKED